MLEARALLSLAGGGVPSLLVGFSSNQPTRPVELAIRTLQATIVKSYESGPVQLSFPEGTNLEAARDRLQATRGIRYAELNGTVRLDSVPNDPLFGSLWGLQNGNDVDIDAPEAWDVTTGSPNVIVAVIDSGIDTAHPDLQGQFWINPGEIPGNGIDDDRNGFRDDVRGWNFAGKNASLRDDSGHGTHVAGTIAARMNNSTGVVGVAPGVRIMPLKFIGPGGDGSFTDAVAAIYYAVNQGAKVINASWGGGTESPALADAIRFAGMKNVVVVTAAGNDRRNNDVEPSYPANFNLANVISVAAVNADGSLASFSNYGAQTVDVAAPGVAIRGTTPGGGYGNMQGTSMAVPHVSGVVALLASRFPQLDASQLADRIRLSAKPLPALAGLLISPGIVSASRALNWNSPSITPNSSTETALTADALLQTVLGSNEYYAVNGGSAASFVQALYRDVLARSSAGDPGASGWIAAIQAGTPRGEVVRAVISAPEARRTLIARWFQDLLGRNTPLAQLKADPTIAAWADQIAAGRRQSDIMLIILGSTEYYNVAGGTPRAFVDSLYLDLLERPATLDPGSSGWVVQLQAGVPRHEVARVILNSQEMRQTLIARWFRDYLRRTTPLEWIKYDPNITVWASQLSY